MERIPSIQSAPGSEWSEFHPSKVHQEVNGANSIHPKGTRKGMDRLPSIQSAPASEWPDVEPTKGHDDGNGRSSTKQIWSTHALQGLDPSKCAQQVALRD